MARRTALILLSSLFAAGAVPTHAEVVADVRRIIQLEAEPLDTAVSADAQRTFILLRGGAVEVRDASGTLLGTVQVPADAGGISTSPDGGLLYVRTTSSRTLQMIAVDVVQELDLSGSPALGPADAPVVIAIFNDFQ